MESRKSTFFLCFLHLFSTSPEPWALPHLVAVHGPCRPYRGPPPLQVRWQLLKQRPAADGAPGGGEAAVFKEAVVPQAAVPQGLVVLLGLLRRAPHGTLPPLLPSAWERGPRGHGKGPGSSRTVSTGPETK